MKLLDSFSKNTKTFMKIRWVGAELLRADRRTNRHDDANRSFSAVLGISYDYDYLWFETVQFGKQLLHF